MTLLLRAAGVTMLGLAIIACSGGDESDEAAIKSTFRDFFAAFEDGDEDALAGLLSCLFRRGQDCNPANRGRFCVIGP